MMDDRKSFIVGLKSTKLLSKEKKFMDIYTNELGERSPYKGN